MTEFVFLVRDVVQSKLEKLGQVNARQLEFSLCLMMMMMVIDLYGWYKSQVLDGEEKSLEVKSSSPKKQTTLDSFVKRCNDNNTDEVHGRLKHPRPF